MKQAKKRKVKPSRNKWFLLLALGIIGTLLILFFIQQNTTPPISVNSEQEVQTLDTMQRAYNEWLMKYSCDRPVVNFEILRGDPIEQEFGQTLQRYAESDEDTVRLDPNAPLDKRSMSLHEITHSCIGFREQYVPLGVTDPFDGNDILQGNGLVLIFEIPNTDESKGEFQVINEALAERIGMTFPNYHPNPIYAGIVQLTLKGFPMGTEADLIAIARSGAFNQFVIRDMGLPADHEVNGMDYFFIIDKYWNAIAKQN